MWFELRERSSFSKAYFHRSPFSQEKASCRFGGRSLFEGLVFATPAKKVSLSKISEVNAPGMSSLGMAVLSGSGSDASSTVASGLPAHPVFADNSGSCQLVFIPSHFSLVKVGVT